MVSVGKKPVRRGSRDQLEVDGRASQWQPAALQERNDPQDPSAGDYLHAVTQADPSSTNTSTSNAEEADSQLGDKSIAPSSTWTAGETSLADSQSPLVRIASDTKDSQQGEQAAESPSLGRIPSIMQVGHIDGKADTDKKDTHTHTIEISAGTAEHEHAVDTQKKASFMARLHLPHRQQGKKRRQRRLLREPITTITSSLGRKRTANTAGAHTNGTGTSSAAGLLAVSGSADRSSSFKSDATGHSLSESTSKASDTSPPHSPAVDAEIGINDVRGTNGILKRVHDSWSLIGLTLANIGPVAGQLPPQRSRLLEELLTENSDIKPSQANQYDDDIQTDIPDLLGAFFGVHTAKEYGGYSMLAIGWPLSGLCMCLFSAVLAELSSSYPVAGAM